VNPSAEETFAEFQVEELLHSENKDILMEPLDQSRSHWQVAALPALRHPMSAARIFKLVCLVAGLALRSTF
jgi:hypothetical protein